MIKFVLWKKNGIGGGGDESLKGCLRDEKRWRGANKNKYNSMRVLPIPYWLHSRLLSQKETKRVVVSTPPPPPNLNCYV